ncbi:unnamed protein product [Mycena citricolor]|uniref:Uncharacterized protein n=1 Tax=Mycena citricolor TaxID=2018698 RepID=A0AAD2Q5X4_9AGAR|nr:unnamed protein product [Mycena citricolor]
MTWLAPDGHSTAGSFPLVLLRGNCPEFSKTSDCCLLHAFFSSSTLDCDSTLMSLLSPPPSILLLPSQRSSTHSLSSASSASSSSASSNSDSSHTSASVNTPTKLNMQPQRKIRFAPLPDPRRALLLTDDGAELPLPVAPDTADIPAAIYAPQAVYGFGVQPASIIKSQTKAHYASSSSSPSASPYQSPYQSPVHQTLPLPSQTQTPPPPPHSWGPSSPSKSSTWPKPKSFLRSLRKGSGTPASSTDSLTPTPSVDANNAPSTHSDSWGAPLARWGSTNSTIFGSPLARTQSQTSMTSLKKRGRSLFSSKDSKAKEERGGSRGRSVPPALNPFANSINFGAGSKMRGQKMLNGRVYGRGGSTNPFASARDEDPQFVEWGYGGMGSVKNGAGHSAWSRVQGGATMPDDPRAQGKSESNGHVGMGTVSSSGGGDDDDDGGGMGWVRRRREAREKEAREKEEREREEKEKLAQEAANGNAEGGGEIVEPQQANGEDDVTCPTPETVKSSPLPDTDSTPAGTPSLPHSVPSMSPLPSVSPAGTPSIPSPAALSSISPSGTPSMPSPPIPANGAHVLQAVNLPAGFRGHHHHRSSSNANIMVAAAEQATRDVPSSSSSAGSVSESDTEDEGDEEEDDGEQDDGDKELNDDDGEDEEDEDEAAARRRTALGAGVEKISRHKEQNHDLHDSTG